MRGEDLAILAALVADGRLRPRVGLVLGWGAMLKAGGCVMVRSR